MKKIYSRTYRIMVTIAILFSISEIANAQTPQYFKQGTTSPTTSTLFLNSTTARKTQEWYNPGDFNALPPSGLITKIYFRNSAASATGTYSDFVLSFKQPTGTGFTTTTFETGLVQALVTPSLTLTGSATAGGWFSITLNSPFQYDNTKPLLFETQFSSFTGGITTHASAAGTPNKKLYSSTVAATTGTSGATNWQDFGIDVTTTACAGPTPGSATVSTTGCAGTTLTLSLTGNSVGVGQTYVWESSSTSGGTYAPVNGVSSTSHIFQVAPSTTTWYRAAVTCGGTTLYSAPVEGVVRANLSGTYTINPAAAQSSTNFQSLSGAITALYCGSIAGPVTFNVVGTPTFNEQVILTPVPGASATNTITFNGNGSTINFAAEVSGERGTVKLNGADYITLNNFIINANAGTYGYGIHILNDADFNTINGCTINSHLTSSSSNYQGIVINGSATTANIAGDSKCDDNKIKDNIVNGGANGIILIADGTTFTISNNQVTNNTVQNFYNFGIVINGNINTLIEGNDIKRPTRGASITVFYGIYFDDPSSNCRVSKNKIHQTFAGSPTSSSTCIGINFVSADATAGNENIVSNNIIYDFTGTALHYGIQNNGSDYVKYYHNTILLDGTPGSGTTGTRGFYQVSNSAIGIEFKNNIIKIARQGTGDKIGIHLAIAASSVVSNNNDIFVDPGSTPNYFGFTTVGHATIGAWRTATGQDAVSKSVDPAFADASNGNLQPTANVLNDMGAPVGITTDILGVTRNVTNPDPGAYEFNAGPCSSPPTAGNAIISSASSPICPGASVTLDLENNTIGAGQTYVWQSASTSGGTFTDISTPSGNSSITVNPTATTYYKAVVTCGQVRTSTEVAVTVQPAFPGGINYTINPGGGAALPNFLSFAAAINAISCGVTGNTVFTVTNTTYNEQVILPAIPGLSESNRITFNGNGATIAFTSSNTAERATVKLNGTDFVTFDNFTINANSTTDYGYGVQLVGDADNNTISNCIINVSQVPTASAFAGVVISGTPNSATSASNADANSIINNVITGGYYGITVIGSTSNLILNNIVSGNQVRDFYTYGIYVTGTNNIVVEHNDISRPTRNPVIAFNGIYMSGNSRNARISKNRIHNAYGGNPTTATVANGIVLSGANGTAGNENVISNNVIYDFKNQSAVNGLSNDADYVKFYHNTVVFDEAATTPVSNSVTGFYNLSDVTGVQFKNNIIVITRTDASLKRAMTLPSNLGVATDHNVLYVNAPGTDNSYVLLGATIYYRSLDEWKASNGGLFDQHSKSVNPLFTDAANGNLLPMENAINNMGANVGITSDILDVTRLLSNPDPGAYEFANTPCSGTPAQGTGNVTPGTPVCAGERVTLSVSGHTVGAGITYQWSSSSTAGGTYNVASGVLNYPDFEVIAPSATTYYKLTVMCGGNSSTTAAVDLVVKQPMTGVYTIIQGTPTNIVTGGRNFQSFTDAQDFLKCGIAGPVVLNVSPGTFNEQFILNSIAGTSATNTITINGGGATITKVSTNPNERGVIKLNGTSYVTIKNLVIEATGSTSTEYGYGVQIMNNADNNTISNCAINITMASTSTNFAGIVVNATSGGASNAAGDSQCDYNSILGNTIKGGYVGVSILGNGTTNAVFNNIVSNNIIQDFYTYGIYLNGTNGAFVQGNDVSRPTRGSGGANGTITSYYGVYLATGTVGAYINGNKLHNTSDGNGASTAISYGVYTSTDATAGNPNIISNNMIYAFNSSGTQYGLYNTGAPYAKYYYNSVLLDGPPTTTNAQDTRGIYQTTTATGLEYKNNIVYISRPGIGENHCIYMNAAATTFISDNNDFYITSNTGTLNNVGYYNSNQYPTLANWTSGTGKDANSVSSDPVFVSSTDLHVQAGSPLKNKGVQIPSVSVDFDGNIRPPTPVIGADEFGALPATTYVFIGNGDWNLDANWLNNNKPASPLPAGSEIFVNPTGVANLNVPFTISAGAKISLVAGKQFIINNNLTIQ